jgi:hypothetical protein
MDILVCRAAPRRSGSLCLRAACGEGKEAMVVRVARVAKCRTWTIYVICTRRKATGLGGPAKRSMGAAGRHRTLCFVAHCNAKGRARSRPRDACPSARRRLKVDAPAIATAYTTASYRWTHGRDTSLHAQLQRAAVDRTQPMAWAICMDFYRKALVAAPLRAAPAPRASRRPREAARMPRPGARDPEHTACRAWAGIARRALGARRLSRRRAQPTRTAASSLSARSY